MMYPDAYLNHYADRYVALNLRAAGVSLDQYLARPDWFAGRVARLLPRQMPAAGRALTVHPPASAVVRNGTYIEPLHHRRMAPSSAARGATFRARAEGRA